MNIDAIYPFNNDKNRREILLVEYDGFIKNITEGILHYILSEPEEWDEKYPKLYDYEDLDFEDIYEQTFLYDPYVFLKSIANETLSDDQIFEDIEYLRSVAIIENQSITKFEFALYQLLQQKFVTKCFIIKGAPFHQNEKDYIREKYIDVLSKVTLVEGGILDIIKNEFVTTAFINDMEMLFEFIVKNLTKEELQNRVFVVLNNYFNTEYNDESGLLSYLYEEECEIANNSGIFAVSRMYNEAIELDDDSSEDNDNEDYENEEEN